MTKRKCFTRVEEIGVAIEKLADALDPQRKPPFSDDILDLLEWAERDVLEMRQQLSASQKREAMLRDALTESRRELDSCQEVIWLASDHGFDPAYVKGAQASIRRTDEALAAQPKEQEE